MRFARFVSYGTASALAWAGAWIGLGYFLSDAVTGAAAWLGIRLVVLLVAAFVLYLPFQRARRHWSVRPFRQARIGVHGVSSRHALEDDLDQCMRAGVSVQRGPS